MFDQVGYEPRSSLRECAQRKSFADSRKPTSLATRDIVFDSQYLHVSLHRCPQCAICYGKEYLHLDYSFRRRASGGQNECPSHTHVPCNTLALVLPAVGPIPTENYGCIHSITNALPSFGPMFGCLYNLSVSTFPVPTSTSKFCEDYGNQGLSASCLKSRSKKDVLLRLATSFLVCLTSHCWGIQSTFHKYEAVTNIDVKPRRQTENRWETNVHCGKLLGTESPLELV
jgi:hypothetical protein